MRKLVLKTVCILLLLLSYIGVMNLTFFVYANCIKMIDQHEKKKR